MPIDEFVQTVRDALNQVVTTPMSDWEWQQWLLASFVLLLFLWCCGCFGGCFRRCCCSKRRRRRRRRRSSNSNSNSRYYDYRKYNEGAYRLPKDDKVLTNTENDACGARVTDGTGNNSPTTSYRSADV